MKNFTMGFAILLVVLGLGWIIFYAPVFGIGYGYSNGERTGDIYKFSEKGLIWKSWEGEMYLGGMVSQGGNLQMEKFYFSIPQRDENQKKDIIKKIRECSQKRKEMTCTIEYKQWLVGPIYQSSRYTVVGVKQTSK